MVGEDLVFARGRVLCVVVGWVAGWCVWSRVYGYVLGVVVGGLLCVETHSFILISVCL